MDGLHSTPRPNTSGSGEYLQTEYGSGASLGEPVVGVDPSLSGIGYDVRTYDAAANDIPATSTTQYAQPVSGYESYEALRAAEAVQPGSDISLTVGYLTARADIADTLAETSQPMPDRPNQPEANLPPPDPIAEAVQRHAELSQEIALVEAQLADLETGSGSANGNDPETCDTPSSPEIRTLHDLRYSLLGECDKLTATARESYVAGRDIFLRATDWSSVVQAAVESDTPEDHTQLLQILRQPPQITYPTRGQIV